MDVVVNEANIVVFLLAIVAFILVFIIFKKIVKFILILVLLAGLAYYVFGFSNMIRPKQKHARYSINYVKEHAYQNMKTHKDSVKYFYIIEPIYKDMTTKYTEEQLLSYERHPKEYYKIVKESINRNKKDILRNLAKQKEEKIFNQFWTTYHLELKKNMN